MLEQIKNENVLFLDIETVPQYREFPVEDDRYNKLWQKKAEAIKKQEMETAADVYNRAGIYAEFGKIICISAGFITTKEDGQRWFRVKSFFGDDEKKLLEDFAGLLNKYYNRNDLFLCAHNGKEFDFPYIARRMLINSVRIPAILDIGGKKPWEVRHLDTLELWKFGDYKNYTSLELLTHVFNIPTPKDDIDGSMVADIYWKEKDLKRIVHYCEKDVLAVAQVFLRYKTEAIIAPAFVESMTTNE